MAKNVTICVGTLGMGMWRSPDGGDTWGRGRIGEGYQGGKSVFGMAAHPQDPSIIYAGANDGIYLSRDRGAAFQRLPSPMDGMRVWRVAVDPVDPDTVFAGSSPVLIHRSRDAGRTWEMVCDDFVDECPNVGTPRPTGITIDPTDHRSIWVSVEVDGLRRSTDGGDTWTRVSGGGLDYPDLHGVTIVPSSPKAVIATTEYDVLVSEDMGESWRNIRCDGSHFPLPYTRTVVLKEGDPSVMFAAIGDQSIGSAGAVSRSLDGGEHLARAAAPRGSQLARRVLRNPSGGPGPGPSVHPLWADLRQLGRRRLVDQAAQRGDGEPGRPPLGPQLGRWRDGLVGGGLRGRHG